MSNRVSSTISDDVLNRIIQIESAGNPNAKAATSSALGLGQQLNATWLNLVNSNHREWWNGRAKDQVLALRKNPSLNIELLARLTEENARAIGTTGGGDLYLAHFLGPADAKDLFRANPNTPVSKLVQPQVIAANRSIMEGKTAGDVRAWANRKMSKPPAQDWVGRFYTGKGPDPKRIVPQDVPSPVPDDAKGTAIEKPEPPEPPQPPPTADDDARQDAEQDAEDDAAPRDPVPQVTPAPTTETQIQPKPREGFFEWVNRKAKTVVSGISGIISGVGGLAYFTDWKVVAVIVSGLIIGCSIAYAFWLLAQRKKPKPVDPS